ncbi:hypothetical protein AMAG_10689 [Allomyces macrogynus ATCC 38327]|uniref:F-box domain-containing protein n=1 Tax=Allomyces macrogynus (strain ATCC 38327) TaxID=578462 RepID=A0A0L0SR81_ALLM3|nr:hypothetical protein AMAG_10689 [Allomyces macrogynus ATCC 38327]|eukprot:KNE65022.1 hypothetical protein AMAG_10689 [Allomyces macrogynus ATCC 38327]
MTSVRASIERLPFDVVELICQHVHGEHGAGRGSHLFEFAFASAFFLAPAVRAALCFRPRHDAHWPAVYERNDWETTSLCHPNLSRAESCAVGSYFVTWRGDGPPTIRLALPARDDNRARMVLPWQSHCSVNVGSESSVVAGGPSCLSLHWSFLKVPLRQVMHFQIGDKTWPQIPEMCRFLSIDESDDCFDDDVGSWPQCPSTVVGLSLNTYSLDPHHAARYLPPHLRSFLLTIKHSAVIEALPPLFHKLPRTLVVLKLCHGSAIASWFRLKSRVSQVGAALASLPNLMVFHHELLSITDVSHVLQGLASRRDGQIVRMRTISLSILPPDPIELLESCESSLYLTPGAQWEAICHSASALLDIEHVHLEQLEYWDADSHEPDHARAAFSVLCFLPAPTHSLSASLVGWYPEFMPLLVNRIAQSPTMFALRLKSQVRPRQYDEGTMLSQDSVATSTSWILPSSLTHINLSSCHLTSQDLEFLAPRWPSQLKDLNISCNDITTVATPFPLGLRSLNLAENPLCDGEHLEVWIEALPPSLRKLNVVDCGLPEHALELIGNAVQRSGMSPTCKPRLVVLVEETDCV